MKTAKPHEALFRAADELVANGQVAAAIVILKNAITADPRDFTAWIRLGKVLYSAKQYPEAVQVVRAAERFDPLQADFQAIQRCMQARDIVQARAVAHSMLEKEPGHPRAIFSLAHLAQAEGDHETRVEHLQDGLHHSPANLILRHMLIGALEDSGAYRRAVETARHLVEIESSFGSLWTLTEVLLRYGLNKEALAACDRAEPLCAGDAAKQSELNLVRGQVLRILGQRENSIAALHACLTENPQSAAGWWALADLKTYRFSEADQQAIRQILTQPATSADQKSMAAFALAKASEMDGDWDRSMQLYQKANTLHPAVGFVPEQFISATERLVTAFTPDALSARATETPANPAPIFIVGLPRSGSTLVEQILASHSRIEGTIEQPVLPSIKRKAHRLCIERFGGDYLNNIGRLPETDLSELGLAYLTESALFRTENTEFFTDKMPFNFEHVGLIHKILPSAFIIDIRRNPLDCGFSLYKQHFSRGSGFSYDLGHIGHYYNGYLRVMDHWDNVLPGRVLQVQYEELVRAPEQQIGRILTHIGVAFEPACLDFHKSTRAVRTASSEQVRQPMNAAGIGAWRKVEPQLDALKASLGQDTLKRFETYLT